MDDRKMDYTLRVGWAGGPAAVARRLGVSQPSVSMWSTRGIPAKHDALLELMKNEYAAHLADKSANPEKYAKPAKKAKEPKAPKPASQANNSKFLHVPPPEFDCPQGAPALAGLFRHPLTSLLWVFVSNKRTDSGDWSRWRSQCRMCGADYEVSLTPASWRRLSFLHASHCRPCWLQYEEKRLACKTQEEEDALNEKEMPWKVEPLC